MACGIRVICPIGLYYPGNGAFTDFARNADKQAASAILDSAGRYRNVLGVDALEYTDISCSGGITRRMCTRVSLFVPWAPVLYVAVRPTRLAQFKRDINLTLCMNHRGTYNASVLALECCPARSLVRASDRIIWTVCDMTLYELRFDTFYARSVALRFLKENAHARANDYTLFAATDSTCLDVALTSYFRKNRRDRRFCENLGEDDEELRCPKKEEEEEEEEDDDDDDDDDVIDETSENEEKTKRSRGSSRFDIDLHRVFEMGVWCKVNDGGGNSAVGIGETEQYMSRLTPDELRQIQLPKNPLEHLPVVSYDLETIALLDSTLPRGVETDQRLSSLALTIHCRRDSLPEMTSTSHRAGVTQRRDNQRRRRLRPTTETERKALDERNNCNDDDGDICTTAIVMAYVPLESEKQTLLREQQIALELRAQPDLERTSVVFFRDECLLVFHCLEMLMTNEFFAKLFELDDPADAARIACILVGYNCWEYDFLFLVNRAIFHGYHAHAIRLLWLQSEPRFHRTQLSFDLMLHVRSRYQAQVGSIALKHVSRFFGATDVTERSMNEHDRRVKMQFDPIAIRRLYFADKKTEKFTKTTTTTTTTTIDAIAIDGEDNTAASVTANCQEERNTSERKERFDADAAFGSTSVNSGVNMLRVLLYNVQDCTTVYHLMCNLCFLSTISLYSRHFYVTLVEASHAGNSRLLPNAFTAHALREGNFILPFRQNKLSVFSLQPATVTTINEIAGNGDGVTDNGNLSRETTKTISHSSQRRQSPQRQRRSQPPQYRRPQQTESHRVNVLPRNPAEMSLWYRGCRAAAITNTKRPNSLFAPLHDQLGLMRIDDDKVYLGGINSATSNHYARPICVDFTSFYPSIGCQYGLSMETVYVLTVQGLLSMYNYEEEELNYALRFGTIRCFDYEPADSPHRRVDLLRIDLLENDTTADMRAYTIRGRDDFAAAVIRQNRGWYEGVEFATAREMIESSTDCERRRILIVSNRVTTDTPPVICSLWRHYLNMRKSYKRQIRELPKQDVFRRRVLGCMEKMFKVVANSLYGYLNYKRSIVYSPQVAAAVTLLSRKTFYETAWLCEIAFPVVVAQRNVLIALLRETIDRTDEVDNVADNSKMRARVTEPRTAFREAIIERTSSEHKRVLLALYPMTESELLNLAANENESDDAFRRRVYRDISNEALARSFVDRVLVRPNGLLGLLQASISSKHVAATSDEIAVGADSAPKCEVVYRDTDGLMLFLRHRAHACNNSVYRAITRTEQIVYEGVVVRLVNDTFARYGYESISLDLEDSGVEISSIMGKKKYWKTLDLARDRFVTKGFEKNAQSFVKHIVRVLQHNTAGLLRHYAIDRCRLVIRDFDVFFGGMFSALNRFYLEHGIDAFAFYLTLNPRTVSGAESSFIQNTIERYNYNPGDRVRCVFLLGDDDPTATMFLLASDYQPRAHKLNYYKIIRRLAVYFVQLVEGFKRILEKRDSELYTSARVFDERLRRAYALWLRDTGRGVRDAESTFARDPFFETQPLDVWNRVVIPYLELRSV